MIKMTTSEFETMSSYIRTYYGVNLEKKQYLIESKLWIELARAKVTNYTAYWQLVRADRTGRMEQRMMDLLTTNYTYFCREEKHFQFMKEHILPSFHGSVFRIWCAGCATGQECYTLAMYLMEAQELGILKAPFEILGTDLSEKAVKEAQKAAYKSNDYGRLSQLWKQKYCEPFSDGMFKIKSEVKKHVMFQNQNLMQPTGRRNYYQLVFLRNVLIYFREQERNRIVKNVAETIREEGYLFIGHTESLFNCPVKLTYIQPAVYRKEKS